MSMETMKVEDVLTYLNTTRPTLQRMVHEQGFPIHLIGRRYMAFKEEIEEWIKKQPPAPLKKQGKTKEWV